MIHGKVAVLLVVIILLRVVLSVFHLVLIIVVIAVGVVHFVRNVLGLHQQPQVPQPPLPVPLPLPQPLFHPALVANVAYIRPQTAIIHVTNGKIVFNLLAQQTDA